MTDSVVSQVVVHVIPQAENRMKFRNYPITWIYEFNKQKEIRDQYQRETAFKDFLNFPWH